MMTTSLSYIAFSAIALAVGSVWGESYAPPENDVGQAEPRVLQGCAGTDKISLQLKWLIQAQFAGYIEWHLTEAVLITLTRDFYGFV